MTVDERLLLAKIVLESCKDTSEEICQGIDFTSRVVNEDPKVMLQKLHRLECLGFESKTKKMQNQNCEHREVFAIQFKPKYNGELTNATDIVIRIIEIIFTRCCKDCAWNCIKEVDFSQISNLEGFDEMKRDSN